MLKALTALFLVASFTVILLNLRVEQRFTMDYDTVGEIEALHESGWRATHFLHAALPLGYIPYLFLTRVLHWSGAEALVWNFGFYGCAAVAAYFFFAMRVTGSAAAGSILTFIFTLTPAVQFNERFMDDNFLCYWLLFPALMLLLLPGPKERRLIVWSGGVFLFAWLLFFQPGLWPALVLSSLAIVAFTFTDSWSWRQRFVSGAVLAVVLALAIGFTSLVLSWITGTHIPVTLGLNFQEQGQVMPAYTAIFSSIDTVGIFAYSFKHALLGLTHLHPLDLNSVTYVAYGYDALSGNAGALVLLLLLGAGACLYGWKQKDSEQRYKALVGAAGIVLLPALLYFMPDLLSAQERWDLLTVVFPFLAIPIFKGSPRWLAAAISAALAVILVCGALVLFTPSGPRSAWQRMAPYAPQKTAQAGLYVYTEAEVSSAEESMTLVLLGTSPLVVISGIDQQLGIEWKRPRFRKTAQEVRMLNLSNAYLSAEAKKVLSGP